MAPHATTILACLLLAQATLSGEEGPLASWAVGPGLIAGAAAEPGLAIAAGAQVEAGAELPARLDLPHCPGSTVILAPGSVVSLVEEAHAAGGAPDLVLNLIAGAVQVDLQDRGDHARLLVRGAALEIEVTGTLLTAERVTAQEDYVVLVHGLIRVRLRHAVAEALNRSQDEDIELGPKQGVGGATGSGLGSIASLSVRPQLIAPRAQRRSLQEQAKNGSGDADEDAASWELDLAGSLLDELVEALADTGNQGAAGGSGGGGATTPSEPGGSAGSGAEPALAGRREGGDEPRAVDPTVRDGGDPTMLPPASRQDGDGAALLRRDGKDPAPPRMVDIGGMSLAFTVIESLSDAVTEQVLDAVIEEAIADEVMDAVNDGLLELGAFPDPP